MPDALDPPPIYCATCGRPFDASSSSGHGGRRESDWRGVRLQISEKVFVASMVGLANAIAAIVTILTR